MGSLSPSFEFPVSSFRLPRPRGCCVVLAGLLLASAGAARAGVLAKYDFEGPSLAPAAQGTWIAASAFGYAGDGTTNFQSGYSGAYSFRSTLWPTNGMGLDDHFAFSITVEPGFIASVTNLTFAEQRSGEGPSNWVARYSTDGATFHDLGRGISGSASTWHLQRAADALPLDLTGAVYFRLYATNAASGSGTWRVDEVTLLGTVDADDGTRDIRRQGFDGADTDDWSYVPQPGSGTVAVAADRVHAGAYALKLSGSDAANADPAAVFTNASLAGASNVTVSVAFAADGPDSGDDLYLDVSYDGGATWNGAGSVKLVDGFDNADIAFGGTSATNPATVAANPYTFSVSPAESQVALRVRYDEVAGADNRGDHYYVDTVRLRGRTAPATNAPGISNYGGITGIGTNQATVRGHVTGGYPYPEVTIYWGPADGGTNRSAWSHEAAMGATAWGVFSNTLGGLSPGQVYYYRCYARNVHGEAWASGSTNFATLTAALAAQGKVCIDSFGVSANMPLCIDRDGNGLSDPWESQYLGGTANDPAADPDADGWSNRWEFAAGTDPTNADSFLRVTSCDVSNATSQGITITWRGGDFSGVTDFGSVGDRQGRTFIVNAAANYVTNRKARIASVADTGAGTNSYTDANAAGLYARRYYSVGVSYGGTAYTNVEEWAAYTQNRTPGSRYLVCMPVSMPTAAERNLNSTAGRQLGRGLHAGSGTSDGDRLEFLAADGAWKQYFLLTNAAGEAYWYDEGTFTTANVPVTAGMAFWLVRGAGAAPRTNAVFAGKSYAESDVADFTFKTNYGGWTLFGWPLAQERSHRRLNPATNQLGFYAVGTGGRTSNPDRPGERGDEIWIWRDNTWKDYFWLIGNSGKQGDGRWWDSWHTGDYADFSLEPGMAFYYLHRTNFGGTNFTWRPQIP